MTQHAKIALVNVRVFNGQQILEPNTVIIDNGLIGTDGEGAVEVDGQGGVLLPGLIDAHIHLHGLDTLEQLVSHGITTGLDMACRPPSLVDSLRGHTGLTDIRSPGQPAASPLAKHTKLMKFPADLLVSNPEDAAKFVADRVSEGSDYIKIICAIPGHDQSTLNALVAAAHEHNKLTIAHAADFGSFNMAQAAQVDMVTHAPLDKPLDNDSVTRMLTENRISIPTLSMMKDVFEKLHRDGDDYAHAKASVTAMYKAGVPILAGTDANAAPHAPANIVHGESLHSELELLVDAGLSTIDALRAATSLPAKYFALHDRGVIEPGRRADLVLVAGDPIKDIRATRQIRQIWCGGVEYHAKPTSNGVPSQADAE